MDEKKSFVLHSDLIYTVKKLPKEKAGELFLHILQYVNDEEVNIEDLMIDVVFEPIKHQLKRDLNKWNDKRKSKSDNGKLWNLKRWHKDLFTRVENGDLPLSEAEKIAKDRKGSVPIGTDKKGSVPIASIPVSVSVIKKEIDKSISKKRKTYDLPWFKKLEFSTLEKSENKFYLKLKQIESMVGSEFSCNLLDLEREKCINWAKSNGRKVKDWKATFSNWMINRDNKNLTKVQSNDYTSRTKTYQTKSITDQTRELLEENRKSNYQTEGFLRTTTEVYS